MTQACLREALMYKRFPPSWCDTKKKINNRVDRLDARENSYPQRRKKYLRILFIIFLFYLLFYLYKFMLRVSLLLQWYKDAIIWIWKNESIHFTGCFNLIKTRISENSFYGEFVYVPFEYHTSRYCSFGWASISQSTHVPVLWNAVVSTFWHRSPTRSVTTCQQTSMPRYANNYHGNDTRSSAVERLIF